MLCLSQDLRECGTVTSSSALASIGVLSAFDDSIDSSESDAERKKVEVLWKVRLNDSKAESASERGAKKVDVSYF